MVFRRFRATTAAYPQRGHATAAHRVEKRTHAGPRHRGQVVGIFMTPNDAGAMPTLFQVLTPWVSDGSAHVPLESENVNQESAEDHSSEKCRVSSVSRRLQYAADA